MNMFRKCFLLLIFALFIAPSAYSLSIQEKQWADNATVPTSTGLYSPWFEVKHFESIDYVVVAASGSGIMRVEYASDVNKVSVVEDLTVAAFSSATPAGVFGSGITKFYTRTKLECTTPPCVVDAFFTAKGKML